MIKISVFNKINDSLIVDAFKNVFQRRSSEVFQPDVPECHTLYMLVGHLQKISKSVSSESDLFSTCLWLLHQAMTMTGLIHTRNYGVLGLLKKIPYNKFTTAGQTAVQIWNAAGYEMEPDVVTPVNARCVRSSKPT